VFGSGNYLGIEVNTSKYNKTFVVSSVTPYFTNDGVSRTLDFYHRNSRPYGVQGGDYALSTTGTSARFGVPFGEFNTVFFGAGVENTKIVVGTNIPAAYLVYASQFGYSSFSMPLTVGWSRDTRDSALAPNSGTYQRVNGDWGVGGDARYLRASYQYQQYIPLNKQFTIALNGDLGWGKGLAGSAFPVFKGSYAGGLGSVRGFEQGTLGPRDVTGAYIGGPKKMVGNIELQTPFPGAGNDRTLRMFGFVDMGNVFAEHEKYDFGAFRASTGVGLSWISPIGPLRFAYSTPLRKFSGDKIQKLQFQIGTSF
jgi:outer membrane protein insertion porin family